MKQKALPGWWEELPAGSGEKFGKRWARAVFPAQGSRSLLLLVESYLMTQNKACLRSHFFVPEIEVWSQPHSSAGPGFWYVLSVPRIALWYFLRPSSTGPLPCDCPSFPRTHSVSLPCSVWLLFQVSFPQWGLFASRMH